MEEIIITIILTALFMMIVEAYGPIAVYQIVNRYLVTVCKNEAFISVENTPTVANLHTDFEKIKDDAMYLLDDHIERLPPFQEVDPTQELVTQDDGWRVYMLYINGRPVAPNIARCMETAKVVHKVEGYWNVFISYYGPGKHVPPAPAMTKGLFRYHLCISSIAETLDQLEAANIDTEGLTEEDLARQECFMIVGNAKHTFKCNEGILYDPTYPTGFVNHSYTWLVVLTIDLVRPLTGFALGINRLALGLVAKHSEIDMGIRRAIVRIPDSRGLEEFRETDPNIVEVQAEPQYY